ncbi:MAG: DUF2809 domain-containing protein [Eubacteriales bacterium]
MKWRRAVYGCTALALLVTEVLIALFVHDRFVRPFGGDVLATVLLCCLVRMILPEQKNAPARMVPLFVFLFALCVELLQGIGIVSLLGLSEHSFFRILIGTTFSYADICCYAVGCAVFTAAESGILYLTNK